MTDLQRFIQKRCVRGDGVSVTCAEFRRAYREWGGRSASAVKLKSDMLALGVEVERHRFVSIAVSHPIDNAQQFLTWIGVDRGKTVPRTWLCKAYGEWRVSMGFSATAVLQAPVREKFLLEAVAALSSNEK